MRQLQDILTEFNELHEKYSTLQMKFVREQSEILRGLSCVYKEMADHRIIYHEKWMSHKYNSTAKSNAAKESEADMKVPEIYQLRHIMSSCKMVIDSVRSTISIYKQEV